MPTADDGDYGRGSQLNNGDPIVAVTPNPPENLQVKLLPDNVTLQLSVTTLPYSLFNRRGLSINETIRFWFTPATSADPSSITNPAAAKLAFAKATILQKMWAPKAGGQTIWTVDGQALGRGVFWATITNPYSYGILESQPAGPAFLDQEAQQRLLDSSIPGFGSWNGFFPPFLNPDPVTGSTLTYYRMTSGIFRPSPLGSYDGVVVWFKNYFGNQPGIGTNQFIEGPYFPRDDFSPEIFLQADYDSTASNWMNIAHNVTLYLVPVSQGRTHPTVTSCDTFVFTNGIGF